MWLALWIGGLRARVASHGRVVGLDEMDDWRSLLWHPVTEAAQLQRSWARSREEQGWGVSAGDIDLGKDTARLDSRAVFWWAKRKGERLGERQE